MTLPGPCFTLTQQRQKTMKIILRYHTFYFKRFIRGRHDATEGVFHSTNRFHLMLRITHTSGHWTGSKNILLFFSITPLSGTEAIRTLGVVLWFETKFKDMSMLNLSNQAAVEALCSGTYLENYLDTIESLPDDLQRNVTLLRELDIQSRGMLAYLFRLSVKWVCTGWFLKVNDRLTKGKASSFLLSRRKHVFDAAEATVRKS